MRVKTAMLLGDSIRLGYQEEVCQKLGEDWTVWAPEENCRFSSYTLNSLRMYLPECPQPDVIHWNNGLWDTNVIYPEDGCFTPLAEYLRHMERILRELKKTGARIIFATTTPVDPRKEEHPTSKQFNADIDRYNAAMLELLHGRDVIIHDLNALLRDDIAHNICEDHIHLSELGYQRAGQAVARKIRACVEAERV